MDVRTVRDSDAATVISALLLCLIKSYFDIWNSAFRASLTSSKRSTFYSRFPRHNTWRHEQDWFEVRHPGEPLWAEGLPGTQTNQTKAPK